MIKYVIAKPYWGGLCYFLMPSPPTFMPAWVPEVKLATLFDTEQEALQVSSFLEGALVEPVAVENTDPEDHSNYDYE